MPANRSIWKSAGIGSSAAMFLPAKQTLGQSSKLVHDHPMRLRDARGKFDQPMLGSQCPGVLKLKAPLA